VTGSLKFTLAKAGDGTPAPATAPDAEGSSPSGSGGVPIWVWIVGAAVLLAGGAFFALRGGAGDAGESGRR
jgi:hypothetical protein